MMNKEKKKLYIEEMKSYFNKTSENYALESKLAVDEIMIQLINEGLNDPDYFNDKLNDQIDSIYKTYPDSKYIDYLAFILSKQNIDSVSAARFIDKINNSSPISQHLAAGPFKAIIWLPGLPLIT